MPNFLDETGLQALWNKCVSKFAPSTHNHDIANIVSGVLPVNLGGTGATDAATALSNLGGVPTSRTINGKALSGNITLTAGDVGAAAGVHTHASETLLPSCIEFTPTGTSANNGGYIDFHFNKSTADFTSRIIEETSGVLQINGATFSNGVITATKVIGAVYA